MKKLLILVLIILLIALTIFLGIKGIKIGNFEILGIKDYEPYPYGYKVNPRHEKIVRDGITYNSFVRCVADDTDYDSGDVSSDILNYRITIESV